MKFSSISATSITVLWLFLVSCDGRKNFAGGSSQNGEVEDLSSQEATSKSWPEVVEQAQDSVVFLEGEGYDGARFTGTGFFVSSDGVLATNYHVLDGWVSLTATTRSGSALGFEGVITYNEEQDLALLKFAVDGYSFIEVESEELTLSGSEILILGYPRGLKQTVTRGVVSSKFEGDGLKVIQFDAAISAGSSGSPVLNAEGKAIGVATASLKEANDLNFAISGYHLQRVLAESKAMVPRSLAKVFPRQQLLSPLKVEGLSKPFPDIEPLPLPVPDSPTIPMYPWHLGVTATIFGIGTSENTMSSSWDTNWVNSFGGIDSLEVSKRKGFAPKAFIPKLNSFYVALPYNDLLNHKEHKSEASKVIPWFQRVNPKPGESVCRGRWVQIVRNGKTCYAQWQDCGPFSTSDWKYVFGYAAPKNKENNAAGMNVSPAVRDYFGIKSGQKVHWRFIEVEHVPHGPWLMFGNRF